ncbi:acetate/propionate family kinase [Marinobacter sp. SS21]|uniref:acetate/propionate family kinase n=1 Tax=Marinobacter sp. SS21 TaxID=2979460 RepID=UPI00232C202B|nr:acetate kinase [Marinobacter sp. SS21]MDC0663309.1 acetate kinase [Marinobacter sp. SS21]
MDDNILVVNCGSSSLKLAVFDSDLNSLAHGLAERLNSEEASAKARTVDQQALALPANADHHMALVTLIEHFRSVGILKSAPVAIGHRVVHGGEAFTDAALITPEVIQAIDRCSALAPLHNPVNMIGIDAARALFPDVPQVAVFDTAFHQSLPPKAFHYALPTRFYRDWGVRRYGFHGTSHQFMANEAARLLKQPTDQTSIISAHLGNGCSITAIRNGRSVDTSMGLTPLEGLVMGTRSGDIDPGLFDFLMGKGLSTAEINRILNRESGLLGLSGATNDMRTLTERAKAGHPPSTLAIEVFCFRLARYIGAMMASLDRLDALVFTGGIGENSASVRAATLDHLALLGFKLDSAANSSHGRDNEHRIHEASSRFPVLVVPTNEELVIAQAARDRGYGPH